MNPSSHPFRNKTHFVGIGGIGMSALAMILLDRGISISGSEKTPSAVTECLEKRGAKIFTTHVAENVQGATRVIYGSAIGKDHPELLAAKEMGIPLLHRSLLLQEFLREKRALLVAGIHGKTTTTSLLAHILSAANKHPSFAIGGILVEQQRNGKWDQGRDFVVEADESDGTFLLYSPFGAILTNCDADHLDYWKTERDLAKGLEAFARLVASPLHFFWCGDDPQLIAMCLPGFSYGFGPKNALRIYQRETQNWQQSFSISFRGEVYEKITISLLGAHNVLNAAAVFGLGLQLGIAKEDLYQGLLTFSGIKRRMEYKGKRRGVAFYDDYGHHPVETHATIAALKQAIGNARLVVGFQPHRYSRTLHCAHLWKNAFCDADALIVTDVYAAGELPIQGVGPHTILERVCTPCSTHYVARKNLCAFLSEFLRSGDVFLTLGAGDITELGKELLEGW
jgi:D-alanine-D-alanine ligase/UDP-N-acetylmuramate--alanine ligase